MSALGDKYNRDQKEWEKENRHKLPRKEIKCSHCGNPFCVTNDKCYSCGRKT